MILQWAGQHLQLQCIKLCVILILQTSVIFLSPVVSRIHYKVELLGGDRDFYDKVDASLKKLKVAEGSNVFVRLL